MTSKNMFQNEEENMRKKMNRLISVLTAGVLTLSVFAPVTNVAAATKNKVVEIPVNFTNVTWEDLEKSDYNASKTEFNIWSLGEPSAYSESYRVSYKLCIPTSFMKKNARISIYCGLGFSAADDEWKYGGNLDCAGVEFHDGVLTYWDDEQQKDLPADCASVKKSGDFYVITYDYTTSGVPQADDIATDITKSQAVAPDFWLSVQGIELTVKNSAIYFDDFKLTKADGTVLASKDYTSDKKVEGNCHVAPVADWEKESKDLKLATITDNKVLTVKSTKATVKVGKKVKISATATPATKITYASSNKKVATVDAKGTVTGKKAGKATISVKANGKTVKVAITVKKK